MVIMIENIYTRINIINNIIRILSNDKSFDNVHKLEDESIAVDYKDFDNLGNDVRALITVGDDSIITIEAPDFVSLIISNLISSKYPSYNRFIEQ